jgi:molecular chaperone DnaK (HSP70)
MGTDISDCQVSDCVITVPTFFRQFERQVCVCVSVHLCLCVARIFFWALLNDGCQAMLDAAAIAGLNVLSLMNDHTVRRRL